MKKAILPKDVIYDGKAIKLINIDENKVKAMHVLALKALKIALFCVITVSIALGDPIPNPTQRRTCQPIVEACEGVVAAQDKQVEALKKSVQDLTKRIKGEREPQFLDFLPEWVWFAIGAVGGTILGTHLR